FRARFLLSALEPPARSHRSTRRFSRARLLRRHRDVRRDASREMAARGDRPESTPLLTRAGRWREIADWWRRDCSNNSRAQKPKPIARDAGDLEKREFNRPPMSE